MESDVGEAISESAEEKRQMADKPAEPRHVLAHVVCRQADPDVTAGSEPAASFSGPEASRREEEVPLLASEWLRQSSKHGETTREVRFKNATVRRYVACSTSWEGRARKKQLVVTKWCCVRL